MPRPVGISILAVLSFLVGIFYVIAAIGFLSSPPWSFPPATWSGLNPLFGWLFLLIGLVDLAAGYGLWVLRRWGWALMVLLITINLGIAAGTLLAGFPVPGPILSLAINGFILWYLLRQKVKAAFTAAEATRRELRRVA